MSTTLKILQLLAITGCLTACATPPDPVAPATMASAAPPSEKASATPAKTAAARANPSARATASDYLNRPAVQAFGQALATDRNIPLATVNDLLGQAKRQATVIRLMTPPPPGVARPARDWAAYQRRFVEPIRINRGKAFIQTHQEILALAQARFGVPAAIIAAIIGVETLYGEHLGNFRVLDAVTTLSFDYPDPSRPDRITMFQGQLADLIELHHQGALDATRQLGSYAGAMGIPQFMPTSLKTFAVSAAPPRAIDLEARVDDAILSVANFLKMHGWVTGLPVFAPVTLPVNAGALVEGGLKPTLNWSALEQAGAQVQAGSTGLAWQSYPMGVIDLPLPGQQRTEYRVATPNFFALTQYNRSYFYATAVADLAQALAPSFQLKSPVER